jgi:hypothetical protein
MRSRNSVYLEQKAQTLQQALRFFTDSGVGQSREERLLAFLDQIDFWDWEVESLRFSFQNFAQRAQAFATAVPGDRAATHGILVKVTKAQDVGRERRYDAAMTKRWGRWSGTEKVSVVSPEEALAATLTTWHELLTAAEKTVMAPPAVVANGVKAGVTTFQPDLSRYRKVGSVGGPQA